MTNQVLELAPITILLGYHNDVTVSILGNMYTQGMSNCVCSHIPKDSEQKNILVCYPENNLHPIFHGDLAEKLVSFVTENPQQRFVVCTHSEVLVLRLRALIAEGKINSHSLSLNFVLKNEQSGLYYIKKVVVDNEGEVDDWQDGYFCEAMDEVMRIRKAQK